MRFNVYTNKTIHFSLHILLLFSILILSEQHLHCSSKEFLCKASSRCIPLSWLCDGSRDCSDSADENHEHCDPRSDNSSCFGDQPECLYGGIKRCILHRWLCDGHNDCDGGEDEQNCEDIEDSSSTTECGVAQFTCNSGSCIPLDFVCNKISDCMDGSDELICGSDEWIKPGDHVITINSNNTIELSRSNTNNTNSSQDYNDYDLIEKTEEQAASTTERNIKSSILYSTLLETTTQSTDFQSQKNLTSFTYTYTSTVSDISRSTSEKSLIKTTSKPNLVTKNVMFNLFPWLITNTPSNIPSTTEITPTTTIVFNSTINHLIESSTLSALESLKITRNSFPKAKTFKTQLQKTINDISTTRPIMKKLYLPEKSDNSHEKVNNETIIFKNSNISPKPLREIVRPVQFVKVYQNFKED